MPVGQLFRPDQPQAGFIVLRLDPCEFFRNPGAGQIYGANRRPGSKQGLSPNRTQLAQGTRYDGNFIF